LANTNAPFGFRPIGQQEGSAPTAGFETYYLNSSDTNLYFTGDPVMLSTAIPGFITVPASGSTTGQALLGIFVGCKYYTATVGRTVWNSYFPASVGSSSPCEAYVITNPQQLFAVQATSNAIMGTSNINQNIGFNAATSSLGNQTTGQSVVTLAASTQTANSSFPFRIVATSTTYAPPGANGTSTGAEGYQVMIVRGNNWVRNGGALTATST